VFVNQELFEPLMDPWIYLVVKSHILRTQHGVDQRYISQALQRVHTSIAVVELDEHAGHALLVSFSRSRYHLDILW
jgi:hypothetical protein